MIAAIKVVQKTWKHSFFTALSHRTIQSAMAGCGILVILALKVTLLSSAGMKMRAISFDLFVL